MKKTYNKKSKEDKEREVNELLEKANEGIEKCFTSPEQFKELINYMSKFYNYSFRNTFLIQEQFEGALAVGSYAFWKEKGFTVNKGEKGIKILVPNRLSDYFINSKGEEVKLSKATPEEKRLIEQGEIEVRKGKLIFNKGYVFEVSQTNAKAEDLPKIFPGRWLDEEVQNYDLMYKAMENIANKIGVRIIEPKGELGAVKGVSYPLTKEVALNPRNTQLQNVKTLIHELAHAKLHTIETRDNYTTNEKEFQAEMSAYSVCSYFGLDTSEYSFRYIKNWTKGVELKDKEKLINEVRETVKEYIEIIEETLINNKDKSLLLENENIVEKEIKDEKLRNFLGKDRVVINEITRDELEKIINESNSNVFLKRDEELSIKNEVVAMKVKGKYRDVYIGKDYKLDNLIYVDDNKNLYRIKENIEYDKSLYGIKEQEIMKDLEEKSIESDDWKLSDRDLDSVSFNVMKNTIEELMKENYGDFVRAIISIESGIEDLDILDNIHEKYMDSDFKLINDKFEDLKNEIEREKLDVRDEKKEKEIWRKIREHEEWIKSNGLRGQQLNLENENLSGMRLINLDLRDANFKGADMTQCVIFADLRGADLTGVKINNSEWIGSNINNVTIEANKLNLIEYQMEQEKDVHLSSMDKLKTKTKEKEIKM
jgi:NACalpha-BTF3-like transcription factor